MFVLPTYQNFVQILDEITDFLVVLVLFRAGDIYWGVIQLIIILGSQFCIYCAGRKGSRTWVGRFFLMIGLGRTWISTKIWSRKNPQHLEKVEQRLKFEEYCFESLPSILLQCYITKKTKCQKKKKLEKQKKFSSRFRMFWDIFFCKL